MTLNKKTSKPKGKLIKIKLNSPFKVTTKGRFKQTEHVLANQRQTQIICCIPFQEKNGCQ